MTPTQRALGSAINDILSPEQISPLGRYTSRNGDGYNTTNEDISSFVRAKASAEEPIDDTVDERGVRSSFRVFTTHTDSHSLDTSPLITSNTAHSADSETGPHQVGEPAPPRKLIPTRTPTSQAEAYELNRYGVQRPDTPQARRRNKSLLNLASDSWLLELTAVVCSVVCMGVITVFLLKYRNKQVLDWPYRGLSFNALISVFATVAKASLLVAVSSCLAQMKWIWFTKTQQPINDITVLDNASRGSFGSLQILFMANKTRVAAIGALITLLSLGTSPFAQQVIQISSQERSIASLSRLPIAHRYSRGLEYISSGIALNGNIESMRTVTEPDYTLVGAIYGGLADSNSSSARNVSFSYPTGNCKWPIFSTLAVCSSCINVRPVYNGFDFELPNGLSLHLLADLMASSIEFQPSHTLNRHELQLTIVSVSMIFRTQLSISSDDFGGLECALYYCMQEVLSSASEGIFTEQIVSESSPMTPGSWKVLPPDPAYQLPATYGSGWIDPVVDGLWTPGSHWANRSDLQVSVRNPSQDPNSSSSHNVSRAAIDSIGTFLNQTLRPADRSPDPHGRVQFWELMNSTLCDPAFLCLSYINWNSSPPEVMFRNLAHVMTSVMRMANNHQTFVRGNATATETVFDIQWYWLIYPFALIIAGMVFLAICIVETGRSKTPIFKTRSLALLFHGLDSESIGRVGAMPKTESGMQKSVKDMEMKLVEAGEGLKLVLMEKAEKKAEKKGRGARRGSV